MTIPTFAELAGDTDARLIEASRLFRAVPAMREAGAEGAKQALVSATDAAAHEAALRWLEAQAARGLAMAEMVEGPREDADDTDAWMRAVAHLLIGPELTAYLDGSPMARDPDWPATGKAAMALADPTMRGEATRLLRDMWWRAMQTEQIEARKKPGAFLASVGFTAKDATQITTEAPSGFPGTEIGTVIIDEAQELPADATLGQFADDAAQPFGPTIEQARVDMEETYRAAVRETRTAEGDALAAQTHAMIDRIEEMEAEGATLGEMAAAAHDAGVEFVPTLAPREHPPMPSRRGPQPPLPGAARRRPVDAKEIADAIQALGKASVAAADGLHTSLGISHSTWNNWLAGRNVPRVDVHKARVLSAEIARVIAELERVDEVLRQVVQ